MRLIGTGTGIVTTTNTVTTERGALIAAQLGDQASAKA